ncbi:sporulation histidine kinase inhibitor Sda [Paenibacillus filicis]|uniref:Sporulation histidine kinase inhibitor Sda n=1 Tax=Paenibacillus gyeongsangnamensis TaxID=3388067 RepID=A0ABT4QLC5_9BACL|nr:sporulation histidine kinase inhibitor Sda [Paenibacillus filicis]MCZ8517612.1 sporulation histidine kinase inhibitor Sda [Paenibacillus filicis]
MSRLSDQELIDAYYMAISIDLDKAFIQLIQSELKRRNVKLAFKVPI